MSKKDLVEAAVTFYLDARREEMQAGMRELLSQLDHRRRRGGRLAMSRRARPTLRCLHEDLALALPHLVAATGTRSREVPAPTAARRASPDRALDGSR